MTESYELNLESPTLKLHIFEVALLTGAQSTSDPKAPLRGFLSEVVARSVKIGVHQSSAAGFRVGGVHGAQLVRMLNAYSARPGPQQIWFIPFSAFGLVSEMEQAATRIK